MARDPVGPFHGTLGRGRCGAKAQLLASQFMSNHCALFERITSDLVLFDCKTCRNVMEYVKDMCGGGSTHCSLASNACAKL